MTEASPPLSWGRYADHNLPLVAGFCVGVLGAWGISALEFDPASEIERARALGIVSISILAGHSKTRDIVTFLATLGLPAVGAVGLWLLWNGRRLPLLRNCYPAVPIEALRDRRWQITLLGTAALLLFASFNLSLLYRAAWNPYVGPWIFLGEEGENLAWANSILRGEVYGRDFFCLYGPLLVHPLAWAMQLFEPTALVQRVVKYVFDLAAYGIVLALLYRTCRWRTSFVLFAAAVFALFPPMHANSVNVTHLRFALGLCPLLLLHVHQEKKTWPWPALAGVLLGLTFLFSPEVGVAATVATSAGLLLHAFSDRDGWLLVRSACWVTGGTLAVAVPTLAIFVAQGALGAFFDNVFGYGTLSMLGAGAIQAPALGDFLRQPLGDALYYFGILLLYGAAFAYVLPRVLLGDARPHTLLIATLAVFGSVLFMVAVRRYAPENVGRVALPAVLLWFLLVERSLHEALRRRGPARLGPMLLAVALLGLGSSTYLETKHLQGTVKFAGNVAFNAKWSEPQQGVSLDAYRAGGIYVDPQTAGAIQRIGDWLDRNTSPEEPIYFFPNEAAFYFLFDRPNPTRYAHAYFAVTTEQRLGLIEQLEKSLTRYVVLTRYTWRPDSIPERTQLPEVVQYLEENYRGLEDLGGVLVLERLPRPRGQ